MSDFFWFSDARWERIAPLPPADVGGKQRNAIEHKFCHLKDWRQIATRFDRNLKSVMGAVALAAAVIWWL